MPKSAPYFPFYVNDWLDDENIFDMGLECEGAYIRLLAAMWKRGGCIPDKSNWCCNILRCKPAKWRKIRSVLVDETGVIVAENDMLFNQRIQKELSIFSEKSRKNSENVSKRWEKNSKTLEKVSKKNQNDNGMESGFDGKKTEKANKNNALIDTDVLQPKYHTDIDTDIDKRKETCPELKNSEPQQDKKIITEIKDVFIELPLNKTGVFHQVSLSDVNQLSEIYPSVDVPQQLRQMFGWLDANTKKRKTRSGIKNFINNWLAKEQNSGRSNNNNSNQAVQHVSGARLNTK